MKKATAMILAILIAVSFTATDTFAATKSKDKKKPKAKQEQTKKAAPKKPALPTPTKVRAFSGYNSVTLKWAAVPKAQEYIVYRSVAGKKKFKELGKTTKPEYVDKIRYIYNDYAYRIVATKKDPKNKKKVLKSAPAKIRKNSIRRLRIYVSFKSARKFDNGTIRAGTRIMTDGFGGGRYVFTYKGKRHTVSRINTYSAYPKYQKKGNYNKTEAEMFISSFVKAKKIQTTQKHLIWVSSYTQHLYVFKKKNGRWTVVKDWEISMGTASTPSPTGVKTIKKKVLSHHNIRFWNCFSSWNALHGCIGSMSNSLGRLASHGCVRNANKNAGWLYANCGKGTTVIIY